MENTERQRIENSLDGSFELRRLYNQHKNFEQRLGKLSRLVYLTPQEEAEQRTLKHLKLRGVERMMMLVSEAA